MRHEATEAKQFRENVLEKAIYNTMSYGARPKENPDVNESKNTKRKMVDRRIIPDEFSSDDEKFSPALMQMEPTLGNVGHVSNMTYDDTDLLPQIEANPL